MSRGWEYPAGAELPYVDCNAPRDLFEPSMKFRNENSGDVRLDLSKIPISTPYQKIPTYGAPNPFEPDGPFNQKP